MILKIACVHLYTQLCTKFNEIDFHQELYIFKQTNIEFKEKIKPHLNEFNESCFLVVIFRGTNMFVPERERLWRLRRPRRLL